MQMIKHKVARKSFSIAVLISFISFFASIYIFGYTADVENYELLGLLPLFFGLVNLVSFKIYNYKENIAIPSIIALEFFRMVVSPILLILGEYNTSIPSTANKNITFAIVLMIYELIAIFILINFSQNKKIINATNSRKKINLKMLRYIIFFLVFFLVVVYIIYPNAVTTFKSAFEVTDDNFTSWYGTGAKQYSTGTLERILTTLYTMVFTWVRYLLPVGLFIWIKKNVKHDFLKILMSLILIGLQIFFITSTIMDSIVCMFVLFLVLVKSYPKYSKKLLSISIILIIFLIGGYFTTRFTIQDEKSRNYMKFIAENSNAYAGGVLNVAAIKLVPEKYKYETLFYNIYGAIPFNNSIFGLTGNKLASIYNISINRKDGQIPPTIGASYYYFGFLLAPIESIIYTWLAMKYGKKAIYEKNIWKYMSYILTAVLFVMAFTTYNSAIVLNYTTTLLIPILILCKHTDDKEFYLEGG